MQRLVVPSLKGGPDDWHHERLVRCPLCDNNFDYMLGIGVAAGDILLDEDTIVPVVMLNVDDYLRLTTPLLPDEYKTNGPKS